jgi:hypothetical protein
MFKVEGLAKQVDGNSKMQAASRTILLALVFDPEDGGCMFFRNVGIHRYCTMPWPRPTQPEHSNSIEMNSEDCLGPDSSVGIVTRLRAGRPRNRGFIPGRGTAKLFSTAPRQTLGPTQTSIQSGTPSQVVKRPESEANHSFPSTPYMSSRWASLSGVHSAS